MTLPRVFILNMYTTGLGIARSLGRFGIPVIGISSRTDLPGNSSRYCRDLIGPDSQDEPEKLLEFLMEIGERESMKGILFPTRDADVIFIDSYRGDLEQFFEIPQAEHAILDLIMNKSEIARIAESLHIRIPRTLKVTSFDEINDRRGEIVFPAVIKPVYSYQWRSAQIWDAVKRRKGIRVSDMEELKNVFLKIYSHCSELLIQEWIGGPEDQYFVFGTYFNRNVQCIGGFTFQKMVQFPPDVGLGCLIKIVDNEEVRTMGTRLLKSINFTGIAEVEFKKDISTGNYQLIEINPRHWDQHEIGNLSGVNISYLAYSDFCGSVKSYHMKEQNNCQRYWISGSGIFRRIKDDLKKGKSELLIKLARLMLSKKIFAVWNWQDPIPFCKSVLGKRSS